MNIMQYGLHRSGTCYLYRLLENLDANIIDVTPDHDKHNIPRYIDRYRYVFLVRNPFTWYHSWKQYKKATPYPSRGGDDGIAALPFSKENAVEYWNVRNNHYKDFYFRHSDISIHVRYEDLLVNPKKIIPNIANKFEIECKVNIEVPTKRLDRGRNDTDQDFIVEDPNFMYFNKLDKEEIRYITNNIDTSLLEFYGFPKINFWSS